MVFLTNVALKAQKLPKEEIRALKNELRGLEKNPEKYRQLKQQALELDNQIKDKQASQASQSVQMNELQKQLDQRELQINSLKADMGKLGKKLASSQDVTAKEVVFRVQVGAYRNARIAKILRQNSNFTVETDAEGVKKYLVGKFNSYWEAKKLSDNLSNKGAQAYVVGYIDGQRIPNLKQMPQEYF
jgi:SMC interacting uncharacterized protein involved in chromosome segregation